VGRPEQGGLLENEVSSAPEPDRGAIAFAEKLLTVLDEGRKTATYKCAVLIGLMDLCLERSSTTGAPPRSIPTRSLAEKVIELYWSHVREFPGTSPAVLKQNSGRRQTEILQAIERFVTRVVGSPAVTLARARREAPDGYEKLVRDVEWKLAEMPLPKLQRVGCVATEFLYRIAWDDGVTRREFTAPGCDRSIHFVGEAGDHLVRLSGLLRPVIQSEWARLVARFNPETVPEAQLEKFLFGIDRASTAAIRGDLEELQTGRCFYCDSRLSDAFEVDHFIPWSRHPDNGLDNLVAADRGCNAAKRDHLASADHVARWLERTALHKADLGAIAERNKWERQPDRTVSAARSIYLRLPSDAMLWSSPRSFVLLNRPQLVRVLSVSAP
jgi:hypothetical protein